MKNKGYFWQVWLLGAVLLALPARGQFTNLYYFTGGSDGASPNGGLILSGNILYGTADSGGTDGNGTVFSLGTNGSSFTPLYSFSAGSGSDPSIVNSDGDQPFAGLLLSGNTLFGTTFYGGVNGNGTVFTVNTVNESFTNLHNFASGANNSLGEYANSEGADSQTALILSGNTLYGVAMFGGTNGNGTVFKVNTDRTGYTNLHNFSAASGALYSGNNRYNPLSPGDLRYTNKDGACPHGTLLLSGNSLYGTALGGGSSGYGTVFRVNTDGTGFTNLHNFAAGTGSFPDVTNHEGANPAGGLVLSGNTLYGTTYTGGTNGNGTVFAVETNGDVFTNLHTFAATDENGDNSDGAHLIAGLALSGDTLYGAANGGGTNGNGAVFALHTDGTGFINLYSFSPTDDNGDNNDGANPYAGVIVSGNALYGTATGGGTYGQGTVFGISLPPVTLPQLVMTPSGINFIFTWPADATGFTLQSSTNLNSAAAWSAASPAPVVVKGQNTVTNPIIGAQKFYRLSQ